MEDQYPPMKQEVTQSRDAYGSSYYPPRIPSAAITTAQYRVLESDNRSVGTPPPYEYPQRPPYNAGASAHSSYAYGHSQASGYMQYTASPNSIIGSHYQSGYNNQSGLYMPQSSSTYPPMSAVTYHGLASYHGLKHEQEKLPIEQDKTPKKYYCKDVAHGGDCARPEGRSFVTPSNLSRHVKERAGNMPKFLCDQCSQEFTRKTARDTHVTKNNCKKGRSNEHLVSVTMNN